MIKSFLTLVAQFIQKVLTPVYRCKGRPIPQFEILDRHDLEYFFLENEVKDIYEKGFYFASMQGTDSLFKRNRLNNLYYWVLAACSKAKSANVVELGCWRGHSSYIILRAMRSSESSGQLFIFDSFEGGLSEKTDKDYYADIRPSQQAVLTEAKLFASTEEGVHKVLQDFGNFRTFRGWIPERFQEVASHKFCLVHIDVDLYEPITESLEFFYARLVSGGVIVIDDYGYTQFPGARRAVDTFLIDHAVSAFVPNAIGGCVIIK